jgi:hypothetical protein
VRTEDFIPLLQSLMQNLSGFSLEAHPGRRAAVAHIYSADFITMDSILSLASQGKNHDTATLARSVFEGAVTIGILHSMPEEDDPVGRFEHYQSLEAYRSIQECFQVSPEATMRIWSEHLDRLRCEERAYRDKYPGDFRHWSGLGASMARLCNYVDERESCFRGKPLLQQLRCQFYYATSSIAHRGSHGVSHSVRPYEAENGEGPLRIGPNPGLLPAQLAFAIGSFAVELLILGEQFSEQFLTELGWKHALDLG